jgi:hypothetical protein
MLEDIKMKPIHFLFSMLLVLLLPACNGSFSEEDISRVYHQVVWTLTAGDGSSSEATPGMTRVPVVEVIGNQQVTPAVVDPMITPASTACNLAVSGMPIDVTMPDGTRLRPGQSFSKTWRLMNAGSCTWGQGYSAVWFSGEIMSPSRIQFLRSVVSPGQSIDITIEMVAPKKAGIYQSNWKLSDPNANLFGIGPNGAAPFWVLIEVIEEASTPTPTITPTATAVPVVYTRGDIELLLDNRLDLDSGDLNAGEQDDLGFVLNEEQGLILVLTGSAKAVNFGSERPVDFDCRGLELSSDSVLLNAVETEDYFCYRTGQGLPGFFRILAMDLEENILQLEYLTWAIP